MIRCLNIVVDDIFIDGIINLFNNTCNRCLHDYIIIRNDESTNYKDIKQCDKVRVVKPQNFSSFVNEGNYDAVILHSFRQIMLKLLPLIDNRIAVIWKAWGFDLYSFPHPYNPFVKLKLYMPLTQMAIKVSLKEKLQEIHGFIHYMLNKKRIQRSISRIDFFSGVLQCEYDLMEPLSFFRAKRVFIPYISLSENDDIGIQKISSKNILIGNSNNPTNNHLDAFDLLRQTDIGNRKVYCPLSYGGTPEYRKKVIETGKKLWGKNFVPLTKLLSKDEYLEIIRSCEHVVFYHERQQALGNIIHALRFGCNVFLSPTSVNYKELSGMGFNVLSIPRDLPSLVRLSEAELDSNKIRIREVDSIAEFMKHINDLYDKIESRLS